MSEEVELNVEIEAPDSTLPSWGRCNGLLINRKHLISEKAIVDGVLKDDFYSDVELPNPIHEFIYEYDPADNLKSKWFIHRLEEALNFAKSEEGQEFLRSLDKGK